MRTGIAIVLLAVALPATISSGSSPPWALLAAWAEPVALVDGFVDPTTVELHLRVENLQDEADEILVLTGLSESDDAPDRRIGHLISPTIGAGETLEFVHSLDAAGFLGTIEVRLFPLGAAVGWQEFVYAHVVDGPGIWLGAQACRSLEPHHLCASADVRRIEGQWSALDCSKGYCVYDDCVWLRVGADGLIAEQEIVPDCTSRG